MIQQFHFWVYTKRIESRVSEKYLHTRVRNGIVHNSWNAETTQGSISGRMDKQNVVYTYYGISFGFKKEGNSDICFNIDESWGRYAKWNMLATKTQILCGCTYMYKVLRAVKIIETERTMVVARGWREGENGELLFSGCRVSV